jgi:cytochrome c
VVTIGKLSLPLIRSFAVLALSAASTFHITTSLADDSEPGRAQFLRSCGTCHAVEPGADLRQGPNLGSVYGRTAGSLEEFNLYSEAVKKAGAGGLVWNEETLDKWITSPDDFIPGGNMFYTQADPEKRKLVIGYLKGLSGGAK